MPPWPEVTGAGALIGVLFGLFGVGGSSFATPVLALLGVPGLVAVATPLPAVIPAALAGMVAYIRKRQVAWPVARWSIYGGVPGTIVGAALSSSVGGRLLLTASGVILAVVGLRILAPLP
ncbi:MAG TPA: sulfite exporter TauE/SafE family protein, partial [Acidimicrobiales bacterium]|nr:sulfite exporter TauE/SafE family protein [Acidimicrobiales bacterium]